MRITRSTAQRAAGTALAALATIAVFGTATASAKWAEIPNGTSTPATLEGTLQLSNGAPYAFPPFIEGVECQVDTTDSTATGLLIDSEASNTANGTATFTGVSQVDCADGQFGIALSGQVTAGVGTIEMYVDPGSGPDFFPVPLYNGPFDGSYHQIAGMTVPFTNGTGGESSTIALDGSRISWLQNGLYATGTLELKRPGGGTLTFTP